MFSPLLTILCVLLAVAPATAQYDNGPYNGNTSAWAVNFGFSVSDSFTVPDGSTIPGLTFVYWDASYSDVLTTVDMAIGSTSFGTDGFFGTLTGVTNTFLGTNQFGYALYQAGYAFSVPWSGDGFVTLSNACSTSGCSVNNPIYWDENSGIGCQSPGCPSTAYENTLGSIASESFTLGTPNCDNCGITPEPSSIILFGSGILGLVGILRRKLGR
jgi:hypothetical protein